MALGLRSAEKAIGQFFRERIMAAHGPLARTRAELETLAKEVRELERKAGADGRAENAASKTAWPPRAMSAPAALRKLRLLAHRARRGRARIAAARPPASVRG